MDKELYKPFKSSSKNKKYSALSGYKIKSYIDFEKMEIKQND